MTKSAVFTLLLLALTFADYGQQATRQIGDITLDELKSTSYPGDKDAEAALLYDYGIARFIKVDGTFQILFHRHEIIKVYTPAGMDEGNISIPFLEDKPSGKSEYVNLISAKTYNLENGQKVVTELDPNQVYIEKEKANIKLSKFAMPNVKPGSVIEIEYDVTSPFNFALPDWDFQHAIPTAYSLYEVWMNPFYEYEFLLQGASQFDIYESYENKGFTNSLGNITYHDMIYKFGMKDLPAFRDEDFITSTEDYVVKIDFQLSIIHYPDGRVEKVVTTWPELAQELLNNRDFGKYLKKARHKAKGILEDMPLANLSQKEKYQYLVEYVKSNYRWNGEDWVWVNHSINEVLDSKSGNAAELNLFLVALLREAGFTNTFPVILSTRKNGKIHRKYPIANRFNYVLAYTTLDSTQILGDATNVYLPFDKIPSKCVNQDMGLIIKKDPEWISLSNHGNSLSQIAIQTDMNLQLGKINYSCTTRSDQYVGATYRAKFKNDSTEIKDFLKSYGIKASHISTANFEKAESPYSWSYKASTPVDHDAPKILINAFPLSSINENPFKAKSRKYPIDINYAKTLSISNKIVVPQDYEIEYLPEDYELNNELLQLKVSHLQSGNEITTMLTFSEKKSVYPAEDYDILKRNYNRFITALNEKVILKKQ